MDPSDLQKAVLMIAPILVAVILHEIAHGLVASWRGDPTAREAGRLTLNPLPHVDPVGTIVLPALLYFSNAPFLFGWARPVPVDIARLRNPKSDMVLVALAGPLTNVGLAVLSAFLLRLLCQPQEPMFYLANDLPLPAGFEVLFASILVNVGLAVFNMLPILPLDGGRVLTGLLPLPLARVFARSERFGMLAVLLLSSSNLLGTITWPLRRMLLGALL